MALTLPAASTARNGIQKRNGFLYVGPAVHPRQPVQLSSAFEYVGRTSPRG